MTGHEKLASLIAGMVAGHVVGYHPMNAPDAKKQALFYAVQDDVIDLAFDFIERARRVIAAKVS